MEDPNDADGPSSGRKAHKKKIRRILDSDDSISETENDQLTATRKTKRPTMEHASQGSNSEGTDDSSGSNNELDFESTDDSSEEESNDSNSDQSSEWDTENENENEKDVTQPSTSRTRTRRSSSPHSSSLPDGANSSDLVLTQVSVSESVEVAAKDRDNFQGSSSETDEGESPKTRCPICLRSLPGPGTSEVGSPEGCQHHFCVCCILEWAKEVNTCPVDRHEFSEIVVSDGVWGKEIRRLPIPKKSSACGTQEDDDDVAVISQIEENPTYCEVCGSGDREDVLLLCDGCDQAIHLDCLVPPLTSVPIEEWYCPTCSNAEASRQHTGRTRNTRLLPRTSASQRVLRSIRRLADSNRERQGRRRRLVDSDELDVLEELAELVTDRRWGPARPSTSRGAASSSQRRTTRNRRRVYRRKTTTKKITKKRTIVGKDGEEEEVEEEEVTTTSKRRARKRRKAGGRKSRRGKRVRALSKRFKDRARLAESLGIVPGKDGSLKRKGVCGRGGSSSVPGFGGSDGGVVLNGTTTSLSSRVPTLSIFGSPHDLEYFSEGSDVEGGGGSLAVASVPRPVDSAHARQLAKERLMTSIGNAAERRKALIKERAISAAAPSTVSTGGVTDLLGSIMDSQAVWHGRKSRVKLNPDGSLVVEKPKNSAHTQVTGHGDVPANIAGPNSVAVTNVNNEVNVSSDNARVPSNPAEPSSTTQDSCSSFREGSSGVEMRDRVTGVESREVVEGGRSLWPIRTPETDLRSNSSGSNRKERVQNFNEMMAANRTPSSGTHGSGNSHSRATNNFRSIEHLAGNVIVNPNYNYLEVGEDRNRVLWETRPLSYTKNDSVIITSSYSRLMNSMYGEGASSQNYESLNSPLDLSNNAHKGDSNANELLHRNMYLNLSSSGSCQESNASNACFQDPSESVSAIPEDLRVHPPSQSHQLRSHSVIRENPAIELPCLAYRDQVSQDIHSDITEPPPVLSEEVNCALVTPLEGMKTVGLPGSSGSSNTSQNVNSSVRDVTGGRSSTGGGGMRGTTQRIEYARANSSFSHSSEARDTISGHGESDGGDGHNRPQLLKRPIDEEEDDDKDDHEDDEDEDVDIYSDIEPGGPDIPSDNHQERHGVPIHAIETPPDQSAIFHPSIQAGGSEKYDPAEPSYDTDDEMVIDEEGGNEEESHTSRSASVEGEIPPPPPLPPSLLDSITKSGVDLNLSPRDYNRERSVTPTEEDERRKVIGEESDTLGRPPVGVRVYGILSQGKFGLGVPAYGSEEEDEDDEGCPNFSIYSAASMDIARTVETSVGEQSKKETDMAFTEENLEESVSVSQKSFPLSDKEDNLEESSEDKSDSNRAPTPDEPPKVVEESSKDETGGDDSLIGDEGNYEKDVEKSDVDRSEDEPEKSDGKSDVDVEKFDPEPDKSDVEIEKSDVEAEKSDVDGDKSDTEIEKLCDSKSQEESLNDEEQNLEAVSDKEFDAPKDTEEEKDAIHKEEKETLEESERSTVIVPELEGLETETISEAEEATAFEDLDSSKRRSCGGEEEEGEIIDDRIREKGVDDLAENVVTEEVNKDASVTESRKSEEVPKKDVKKDGKRRTRKKVVPSKAGDATGGDSTIAWKKLSKTGKERNYRDSKTEDSLQTKKDVEDKEDKENRKGKKERDKRKSKRKDLERYDVRKVVGERSKTKRRRTDAFGRELRSNSRSRSRSRIFSRSRSRGIRSRSRGQSRSRGRSRSRGIRSRSRGARSRSRGRRSRSRRSRSRGNSRSRGISKTRGRSRSRGKGRSGRSRSRSRVRQRSRSRGGRSRSRGGRSRSRQKSRDHTGRRGENVKPAVRKRRRTRSPVSERRKQSRSRSRQRRRSRSRSRKRKNEQQQDSWEKSSSRSWSMSITPVRSRSMEKTRHLRSRSVSGSRVYHDRTPPPISRTPSRCRSPSTPSLLGPQRARLGMHSISRSLSGTPERLRSPGIATLGNRKKKRKKDGRRKDIETAGKKKKKRRERSPAASKEVFASGDNILVSVSFKSAPKEAPSAPRRRKASPVEEKVKVVDQPPLDTGTKKKRKFMPIVKKKPSVIIDLETSPFVERVPSPADLIVLSDSSGENEEKSAKQQQQLDPDTQRRHRMMIMSPVITRKSASNGIKEKRVGGKTGKKGKLGGKGKKAIGKKERKAVVPPTTAGIPPPETPTMEEPPMPHSVPEEVPIERRLGPKTPPEPQVKFSITSKGTQLRSLNNPLRDEDDEEDEDEIITSETISFTQIEIVTKTVQNEGEILPQDNGVTTPGEPEIRQTTQVGPNTPPGPSTPDLETFNEVDAGQVSPAVPEEEVVSRTEEEREDVNKETASFEEPARKDQEMDTYDPFEPTNSPAPSPPAPESDQGHQTAEESREAPNNAVDSASQATEEGPPEEEVAVAEVRVEEPSEPKVEEAGPTPSQVSTQGITRTLGATVGPIDAVGGLVLPLLAQLGAVSQPLNAAVAAVTSANSPIVQQQQQQQMSPLVNRAFPQQPQPKAVDVIRTLFGSGLRQFPEMVASSGTIGAFSVSQPKASKTDLSLGGGARTKGGPRVAVTAPRVAVATPRVVAPTPRVAVTPRVATANGKDQAPGTGQDRLDVVDMDLESPYSPASSEGDDLFEPPSYESAGSARQPSILSQAQPPSKAAVKGSQRTAPASSQDKFDNLFGSSPMRRSGGKISQRTVKNHKGSSKSGKQRSKGGKVNIRSEEDHHLTILDELPNSAVEMQVKEKFLIKLNRQERVVEEVKLALKPHYNKKHLSKEEYKDILRRSVPKICHNRSGEINPIKIRSLVEAYVRKFRYARKKDASAVQGAVRSGKGKKVA